MSNTSYLRRHIYCCFQYSRFSRKIKLRDGTAVYGAMGVFSSSSSSSSSLSYISHEVGPLVDPFRSPVSRIEKSLQKSTMIPSTSWGAILPLDLLCSGPVTHSGEILSTGKSHGMKTGFFLIVLNALSRFFPKAQK